MSSSELERLTWYGATDRFVDAVAIAPSERIGWAEKVVDNVAASAHNAINGIEVCSTHEQSHATFQT